MAGEKKFTDDMVILALMLESPRKLTFKELEDKVGASMQRQPSWHKRLAAMRKAKLITISSELVENGTNPIGRPKTLFSIEAGNLEHIFQRYSWVLKQITDFIPVPFELPHLKDFTHDKVQILMAQTSATKFNFEYIVKVAQDSKSNQINAATAPLLVFTMTTGAFWVFVMEHAKETKGLSGQGMWAGSVKAFDECKKKYPKEYAEFSSFFKTKGG